MEIYQGPVVNMSQLSGFLPTAKWKLMDLQEEAVEEPVNKFDFCAPTNEEHDDPTTPKHNFNETFDRPMFKGRSFGGGVRLKGEPRSRWMHDHQLTVFSHPAGWIDTMFPTYKHLHKKTTTPHEISIEKIRTWYNKKAKLMLMGTAVKYHTFTAFTPQEFEQYFYIFFWNGLNPSPQIEWKLQSEDMDPTHSSAFLRRVIGPSTSLWLRNFKCCFACQDPKVAVPPKKTHPKFKVDEYFRHIQTIFCYFWMPGRDLYIDEQTMGFKGKHADKIHITYKKEGDGFQCDCIADNGYTFTLYFRNQPAPKKWIDKGYSTLHIHCMNLFD